MGNGKGRMHAQQPKAYDSGQGRDEQQLTVAGVAAILLELADVVTGKPNL